MRTNLKVLRTKHNLSQQEMCEKIGCCRQTYSEIESGKRNGSQPFWDKLQNAFHVPESDMWELTINDKE